MTAWTFTSASYPAVLAALDAKLTSADIPNTFLDEPIYKDAAIQDVVDLYSTALAETVAAIQARLTRAAIYFLAARLAPAVVRITSLSVTTRDLSYSRQTFDPEKRAADLRALAQEEIAAITDPTDATPNMPTMFSVAPGYRGR